MKAQVSSGIQWGDGWGSNMTGIRPGHNEEKKMTMYMMDKAQRWGVLETGGDIISKGEDRALHSLRTS